MYSKGIRTKERITEAGARLFYQQGYDHTSFRDIARAVGIPSGNFYNHFKTKDSMLDAVIAYRIEEYRNRLKTWESGCSDPLARLHRFVQMLRDNERDIVRYGCPMGTLNAELRKLQARQKTAARKMFDTHARWLEKQFTALGYDDASILAERLLVVSQGVCSVAHTYGSRNTLRRELDHLDQWLEQLVADRTPPSPRNRKKKPRVPR